MPKLRAKRTIMKNPQLMDLQKKKAQIANSFARINTSLKSKKASANEPDTNIFLDILKVAPLIELAEEEPRAAESSSFSPPGSCTEAREHEQEDFVEMTKYPANLNKIKVAQNSSSSSCDLPLFTKNSTILPLQKEQHDEYGLMERDFNESFFSDLQEHNPPNIFKSKGQKKKFLKKQKKKVLKKRKMPKRYFNASIAKAKVCEENQDNYSTFQIYGEISSSDNHSLKPSTNVIELSDEEEEIVFVEEVCKGSPHKSNRSTRRKRKGNMLPPTPNTQTVQTPNKAAKKSTGVLPTFISRVRPSCPSAVIKPDNYNLCGLRYLENVDGMEVSTAGHFLKRQLVVVSYNVLCQSTIERTKNYLYKHLRGPNIVYLSWSERRKLLEMELNRFQADIFCLQEVEDIHFREFFQPYFHKRNFLGVYKKRTNAYPDGCAIFYNTKTLQMVCKEHVSYNLNRPGMDRDNVGQIAVFEFVGTNSRICVANTHLLFNMRRGDIKLNQLHHLLNRMQEIELFIRKEGAKTQKKFVGHILAGDFNIEPISPIYRFVIDGSIRRNLFDKVDLALEMAALSFSEDLQPCTSMSRTNYHISSDSQEYENSEGPVIAGLVELDSELEHNFTLASVYEHHLADGKRETSSYHRDSICPDFIFYSVAETKSEISCSISESFIRLHKRLTLPCVQQLDKACGRLPNSQSGSDHLALLASFEVLCSEVI